ncbi:MAG: NADH:ubiquinone oxidoreductase subunit NDUFA12 [Rhodospirillales bacterium]|nr:NADH:ubiquinone oxidoreductase subunit NDUFA12 [Rhodospirillales bacterium]
MTIGTRLYTFFKGRHVGSDSHGNRYFIDRRPKDGKHAKRWVIYSGSNDASKVPAHWHGWLHGRTNESPGESNRKLYDWQQDHQENLTGTEKAYKPPGHLLSQGKRAKATGDYEPWRPS